jgi:hypothetical protein
MERVLHANEETALNPDPFDPVEPEFVAGAVVGLGTMRQGSDVEDLDFVTRLERSGQTADAAEPFRNR